MCHDKRKEKDRNDTHKKSPKRPDNENKLNVCQKKKMKLVIINSRNVEIALRAGGRL